MTPSICFSCQTVQHMLDVLLTSSMLSSVCYMLICIVVSRLHHGSNQEFPFCLFVPCSAYGVCVKRVRLHSLVILFLRMNAKHGGLADGLMVVQCAVGRGFELFNFRGC